MTQTTEALGLSEEQLDDLKDIEAGVLDDLQGLQPDPTPFISVETAVHQALRRTIGSNRHSKAYMNEVDGRPALAQIMGLGIAHGQGLDSEAHTAGFADRNSGSMVIAAGTGSRVGVEATVRGFERAVRTARAGHVETDEASGIVTDAMQRAVPTVIQAAQEQLEADRDSTTATGLGVQIVDDKLVYNGRQPMLILNVRTKEITRLTYNSSRKAQGVYTLNPGKHIVLMCAGTDSEFLDTNTTFLTQVFQDAVNEDLDIPADKPLETEQDAAQARAAQIAGYVQGILGKNGQSATVIASAIQVDDWYDERSWLRRATDWIRPATFTYTTMAKLTFGEFHDYARRRIYERLERAGKIGKIGQVALRTVDAAIVTGVAFSAVRLAAPELLGHLGQGIGHEIDKASHLLGLSASEHIAAGHTTQLDTHQIAAGANQAGVPAVNDDMTPAHLAQTAGQHHTATVSDFASTYTATAHDPNNGNGPTTISSLARQDIDFYGNQYHLSPDEIARLKTDGLDGAIAAFIHDTSDPDNGATARYPANWVLDGTTYSTHDLNSYVSHMVSDDAHRLGLDTPPPAPQPAATATPAAQPPAGAHAPVVAALPETPERASQIEKIAVSSAAGGVAAAAIGTAAWFGVPRLRSWLRNRRVQPAPLPADSREKLPEPSDDTIIHQPLYADGPAADIEPAEETAETLVPEHVPRHLSLVEPEHSPRHLDDTDPDAEPESSLLGLDEPIDMPEVPALGLNLSVPPAPRQPFNPDQIDIRPAYVDAAYRAFRDPDDAAKQAHWQAFTDGHDIVEQRGPNFFTRLGRRLFRRGRKAPAHQTNPNLRKLEVYHDDPATDKAAETDRELVAA